MTMPASQSAFGPRKRVRMRDVANRCGVSISTVSLVLSGDPRIPEDTARRVLQTVKAMEYRPSVLARSLARRVSRTVGVILPESAFTRNKPFYYQALQGIHSQTQPAGYKMVVEAANASFINRRFYHRMLKEQSADAMVYLAASLNDVFLQEMEKEEYPFILVAHSAENVDLPILKGDDHLGAKMATEHLIKLGHKAIGHMAGTAEMSNGRDREAGYRDAMQAANLDVNPAWIARGNFDSQEAEKATKSLVDAGVTAIFAGGDVMAYGVLQALKEMGKRVPEDIAVVGMDDLEASSWMNPTLTTVRYDIQLMAELATQYVIKRIQTPLIQKSSLEASPLPELVIRESCGGKR